MHNISIQQAIFMTSTIRQKLYREMEKFSTEYRMPIAINGKSIITDEKSAAVHDSLNKINQFKQDLVTIKTAIHYANSTTILDVNGTSMSVSQLLEQVKLDRNVINELQAHTSYGYGKERMKTVSGVGVVEEGIIEEQDIKDYIETLENETNDKSMLIDQFNSTHMIELELLSE